MATRSSLRRRILLGLFAYAALLSIAVTIHGFVVNEQAEQLVWQTLLESELDNLLERRRIDPAYSWTDTQSVTLYDSRDAQHAPPAALRNLAPGVHDEVIVGDVEHVALVREVEGKPLILALNITEMEARERDLALTIAGSAVTMIVLLGLVTAWGVNRLLKPLSNLALRISRLQPDQAGQRVEVDDAASTELVVIADAVNGYLERNERFVERERAFIDSTSHELRTPMAVIAGASELALEQPDMPEGGRNQLVRIGRMARDVENLISLLLVLAKDPVRLARASDSVALDQLLPEIVEDHRHLTRDKDLKLTIAPLAPCQIVAPLPIVQAAIGNLLRNAIENSDRGEIVIQLRRDATLVIQDPGHGMSPEEISALYARLARGGAREGGGIGLDLIARLCEHLGWKLAFASNAGEGTTTTLKLSA